MKKFLIILLIDKKNQPAIFKDAYNLSFSHWLVVKLN